MFNFFKKESDEKSLSKKEINLRQKEEIKKQYNLKMKKYRDDNKLLNAYHCHNYKRRNNGFSSISISEYLEYRNFAKLRIDGKLKSSKKSKVVEWENFKIKNKLFFSKPVLKGNFTDQIKKKILREFK